MHTHSFLLFYLCTSRSDPSQWWSEAHSDLHSCPVWDVSRHHPAGRLPVQHQTLPVYHHRELCPSPGSKVIKATQKATCEFKHRFSMQIAQMPFSHTAICLKGGVLFIFLSCPWHAYLTVLSHTPSEAFSSLWWIIYKYMSIYTVLGPKVWNHFLKFDSRLIVFRWMAYSIKGSTWINEQRNIMNAAASTQVHCTV